ncbi:hypothetical protein AAG906_033084 [Vitis piasezkii]
MRNPLEQVSEVIDLPTHILIKKENEKENIVVNLRIDFHERQQKKLLETLQLIIDPPSKKGKSNFDRCTPSKFLDIVPIPMDDFHPITLVVKLSDVDFIMFHSMGDPMVVSGGSILSQQLCPTNEVPSQ